MSNFCSDTNDLGMKMVFNRLSVVCLQPVIRGLYKDSNRRSVCEELLEERTSSRDPREPAVCSKEV